MRRIIRLRALAIVGTAAAAAAVFAGAGEAISDTTPSNTSLPTISGTAVEGDTLTSSSGSWSGTTPITFSYQWERCNSSGSSCADISSATDPTYKLVSGDVGSTLRSQVTATNGDGEASATSDQTGVVTSATTAPVNTALPTISGTPTVGSTLTASNGTWTGSTPITYTYRWSRCDTGGDHCSNIVEHSDNQSYTLTNDETGHTVRVTVTASNSGGVRTATSTQSGVVGAAPASGPKDTVAPVISGSVTEGQTLTVANGTWSGSSISYSYSWERCDGNGNNCATISGATKQSYVTTSADVGHKLRALVTASNSSGSSKVYAAAVGPIVSSTPSGTSKLPDGEIAIAAASVPSSDRLTVAQITYKPSPISHGHQPLQGTFKVVDEHGWVVQGALVYVVGLPYNWMSKVREAPTGANGRVTLTVAPTRNAPRRGALVMFVRARTPQGSLLAGSSTRRLIQVRLRP